MPAATPRHSSVLYRRHEMRTWRYIERNVGNRATADELMQEVWFAVAREAPRYEPSARFTTWLFTIAHNRMIDWVRKSRPQTSLECLRYEAGSVVMQLTADPSAGPLAAAVAHEQSSALAQALGELPAEQREAFLMQIEGELSVEEIAAVTGVELRDLQEPTPLRAHEAARVAPGARMNELPPPNEGLEEVDGRYRRLSDRDSSHPSEAIRRAVLRHAAELAAQARTPESSAPVEFRKPSANEPRWRVATYGGLAAAALAGLLIAPHFLAPSTAPITRTAPTALFPLFLRTPRNTRRRNPRRRSSPRHLRRP